MPMKTMTTFAIAVALAAAWSVAPALAGTTTEKIEKKDTVGEKLDRGVDKTKEKTIELKDKVVDTTKKAKDKVVDTSKKVKDKVVDTTKNTKDKVVDTTKDTKDKVVEKTDRAIDKIAAKTERMDVRNTQQSLMDKGFSPGPIDGVHGPRTSAAIRDFQTKEGLMVTGQLNDETTARLSGGVRTGSDATAPAATSPAASPSTATPPSAQIPAKQAR